MHFRECPWVTKLERNGRQKQSARPGSRETGADDHVDKVVDKGIYGRFVARV